ncbi:helix-turn-helix domain-containing protein [Paenibacillus sp. FSL R5-0407]|uniref:helix-turn-helix domain-containing protein n=1 Tax=Paenibacillus sp. FSL R5-0407 TaxID=2975320 RepID=UPI0030F77D4F
MDTTTFIEALRSDIKANLREEILAELQPEITRRLYTNIFDTAEACQYLKVSIATLRRMVKGGEVPYFRQRGQLYFRQQDLDKHIASKLEERKVTSHE